MTNQQGPHVGPWRNTAEVGLCHGCGTHTLKRVLEADVGTMRMRLCYRCAKSLCAQLDHHARRKT